MEDDRLVCPYEPSHIIHPLRMPRHLLRCRKNHPALTMAVCPFNANHEVPSQELRYHMAHCPDKALLDRDFELGLDLIEEGSQQRRLKGFTELPKALDDKLYGSDDELWEPSENEDNSVFRAPRRRNLQRSRRRHDEHLRLPIREGRAALLASIACVSDVTSDFESSTYETSDTMSVASVPHGFRPPVSHKKITGSRLYRNNLSESEDYFTSEVDEPSVAVSPNTRDVTQRNHCVPSSISSTSADPGGNGSGAGYGSGIKSLQSKTEPPSAAWREPPTALNLDHPQPELDRGGAALKYKTFLLGRGRAMFSQTEQQSAERSPGAHASFAQGSVKTPGATGSRSDRLSLLVHSLGRGRGAMLMSSAAK